MRKALILTYFILALLEVGLGQTSGFGVGVILGEPTGISVKNFISRSTAVDGALAWSFDDGDALSRPPGALLRARCPVGFWQASLARSEISDRPELHT